MSRILYFECYSGISGDMSVASLLDLGASESVLLEGLESLPLTGYTLHISRVLKSGLDCCDFHVKLQDSHQENDHDMEYLHGSGTHAHHQEIHHHEHHQEKHHHEHRGLKEVYEIIEGGRFEEKAKDLAKRIFMILAEAEAKAHGTTIEEVHFHEVGAVDSIIDIVAFAICFVNLGINKVCIPSLYEGCGFVRAQHGMLPVPVPAVLNIVQNHGIHLHNTGIQGEFVTPTGAAIVAAIMTDTQLPASYTIEATGIGAGKRTYERPSILRAMILKGISHENRIVKLETDIDDSSGEILGYTMERLFAEGARDVHYSPVFMKKNRPAYELTVICMEKDIDKMETIIFANTTTIGIRRVVMERTVLERQIVEVTTSLGAAKVKVCEYKGIKRAYPEFESVAALCRIHGLSYDQVYRLVQSECIQE